MPVLWGLDLKEIHPRKFASGYMWNKVYHLRRTKFIVYQLAMILCVVSEACGTAALDHYRSAHKQVKNAKIPGVSEYSGDFIGVASYNIFNGIYVAFIFGAAFFFDLIWPERREDRGIRWAWKICAISTIISTLASALGMTIVFATRSSIIYGTSEQSKAVAQWLRDTGADPLRYKDNKLAIASIAMLWPGWVACIAACIVLWMGDAYVTRNGPWTTTERHLRDQEGMFDRPTGYVETTTTTTDSDSSSETRLVDGMPVVVPHPQAPAPPAPAPVVPHLKPGDEGFNWHDDQLKNPNRGGGPTLRPSQLAEKQAKDAEKRAAAAKGQQAVQGKENGDEKL